MPARKRGAASEKASNGHASKSSSNKSVNKLKQQQQQQPASSNKPNAPGAQTKPVRKGPIWWFIRVIRIISGIVGIYIVWFHMLKNDDDSRGKPPEDVSSADDIFPLPSKDAVRRDAIREAFRHSWSAYERDAFGADNYHPISKTGSNISTAGGVGYFVIDSLDSLILLDFPDEYKRARDWVANLSFELDDKFHTFEITIRVLGGLLSAYALTQDRMLVDKAVDLADRLLPAFDTPHGIPNSFVNLKTRQGIADLDNKGWASVAEVGTLQLEFKYLSEITGNPVYWEKAEAAVLRIREQPRKSGLAPIFMRPSTGRFVFSDIRLGSRGDSYYEYLEKQYLQTNKTEPVYREMHEEAMTGIKSHLLTKSVTEGLLHTIELIPQLDRKTKKPTFIPLPKQDHLVCFLGATFMLGATEGQLMQAADPELMRSDGVQEDVSIGASLTRTCVDTYVRSSTGLAPEIAMYYTRAPAAKRAGRDWYIASRRAGGGPPPIDARNILRPETVESLFVGYRTTANPVFRDWGWKIFEAFEKHCKLASGGFASIRDVDQVPVEHEDRMETFWLSETLKYLYLLYSEPELVPLTEWVFNTEAHVLPVFTPTVLQPVQERIKLAPAGTGN